MMKEPTKKEMLELVEFERDELTGCLFVRTVKVSVFGDVVGGVVGNVGGNLWGTIAGRGWQFVETPKDKAIRLIREGKGEQAIKVLEEIEE